MNKINKKIIFAIFGVFLLTSCNKTSNQIVLVNNPSVQANYKVDKYQMEMGAPAGICTYDSNIYICDTENHCIVKFSKELDMVESYGTLGMEEGNFSRPMDITFAAGSFYVLDSGNNRIQRFSSNFEYLEAYYLEPLFSEQGIGKYLSIAVDNEGTIYVSAFSPDINDAYIYTLDNQKWIELGQNVIGYLCEGIDGVYFANMLEFHVEEHNYTADSGINILYKIDSNEIKEIARLEDKYVPVALTYWNDSIYMISAGVGSINCFTIGEEKLITVFTLPDASLFMYMAVDEEGNFYVTDNENGTFYRATK